MTAPTHSFDQAITRKALGGILNPDHIADPYSMLHQQPLDA